MAKPLKPFVRGGYYPSSRWTPLVYPGGYTTANGNGAEPTPLIKTVKGAIAHVTDALAMPAIGLKCEINPLQAGTGDPSPTNVRPISGWTGCNIHISRAMSGGTVYPITFPDSAGTVYGGTLDVVNKKLAVEYKKYVLTPDLTYVPNSDRPNALSVYVKITEKSNDVVDLYCNQLKVMESGARDSTVPAINMSSSKYSLVIAFPKPTVETYEDITNKIIELYNAGTPIEVVYKLQTTIVYDLSDIPEITTLLGENNIWHDANGDTELTYYAE